jgi:hypothetical protein
LILTETACLGAIGLVNLLPAFHSKPVLVSVNEISCKQQIIGSSFFNPVCQTVSFEGELSPLTFSVSIDRYVVIPVI